MSVAKTRDQADHCPMRKGLRTTVIAASVAAAALAVGAPSASAGLLVASAPDCSPQPTKQAFASVDGDRGQYRLAPGGAFESASGANAWKLSGGASIVSGNEPWKVNSGSDSHSLKLPPGASAQSPVICVGIEHPSVRLFAKNNRALLSTLAVDVTFETSLGLKASAPIGVLLPNGQWKASPKFLVLVNLLPLLPGEHTPVQFRVTSIGLGTWSVDDFYVDPKCR
jgi:hypothetical protein